jgi:hypothetical protein
MRNQVLEPEPKDRALLYMGGTPESTEALEFLHAEGFEVLAIRDPRATYPSLLLGNGRTVGIDGIHELVTIWRQWKAYFWPDKQQ